MLSRRSRSSAFGVGLAFLTLMGAATVAQANPISGSFSIQIYQGNGPGDISGYTDPREQANLANPLLATAAVGSGTYNGALNFINDPSNTIGAFLLSAGGSIDAGLAAASGLQLSSGLFKLTTVFEITTTSGGINNGIITHDDGIGLYNPGLITPVLAGAPTEAVGTGSPTAYNGLNGLWTLIYVEANGMPAVLDFEVTSGNDTANSPLPAALPLFATGLGVLGLFGWRRKRKIATA